MTYLLLITGFIILSYTADLLVDGASGLAKRLKVSDLLIGMTVVAFGTSAPELVVNLVAAAEKNAEIALTNIMGSNTINTLVILGVCAIITPLGCRRSSIKFEIPLSILAGLFVLVMGTDAFGLMNSGKAFVGIGRLEGMVLIAVFALFMIHSVRTGIRDGHERSADESYKPMKLWKSLGFILAGLAGLVLGSELIVRSAKTLALSWGVSEAVVGVTVVALGTSLPELATSAVAAVKKNVDLAIGNVVGSNIFNVFMILGLSSTIQPLQAYPNLGVDALMVAGSSLLLFLFVSIGRKHRMSRIEGVAFLVIYGAYLVWLISTL